MEKKKTGISQTGARMPVVLLKSLLVSYLMAGALLLLLALLLYRMQLSAQAVSIGILVIYAVTAGLSGWLAGKGMQDRRFLWGLLTGSLYFCVLAALTLIVNHGLQDVGNHFFTTLMICSGAGMLKGKDAVHDNRMFAERAFYCIATIVLRMARVNGNMSSAALQLILKKTLPL